MKEGDIALAPPITQADGQLKNDFLACGVSTQLHRVSTHSIANLRQALATAPPTNPPLEAADSPGSARPTQRLLHSAGSSSCTSDSRSSPRYVLPSERETVPRSSG